MKNFIYKNKINIGYFFNHIEGEEELDMISSIF